MGKGSSRGTPTGPCCNRGTLRNRGTLWEKEAAEVPEVPCWELLKNLELSKSEIFGKGSVLKKKKNILKETSDQLLASHYTSSQNPPLVNHHHHDRGHYMFYPSNLLFLPLDVLALTPSSPNTYPRTYHMCVCTILTYIHT